MWTNARGRLLGQQQVSLQTIMFFLFFNTNELSIRPLWIDNHISYRAAFNWTSQVIRDCVGLALLRSVIGPENSHHSINQSDANVNPTTIWSPTFSRALGSWLVLISSFHWLFRVFCFLLIGRCDNFSFAFTRLSRKTLYLSWMNFYMQAAEFSMYRWKVNKI